MNNIFKGLSFLVVLIFLLISAVIMHPFGYPPESTMDTMDDYFIKNSQEETATNNVVTAILFDYRGLDTLGEATVLFTSVAGVSLLFRRKLKKEDKKEE